MKNSLYAYRVPTVFFVMTLLVAVLSWVASIYEMGVVENVLSAEGIRWGLSHVLERYVCNPVFGISLILLMGIGIFVYGGAYNAVWRICSKEQWVSRKERRALMAALLVFLVYVLFVLLCMFIPSTISRSVTGNLGDSPLCKGWCYVASLGIGFTGAVYGFVSGTLRNDIGLIKAMSGLILLNADYWVSLFFITQFFSTLEYTRIGEWMGMSPQIISISCQIVCCLVLAGMLIGRRKSLIYEE